MSIPVDPQVGGLSNAQTQANGAQPGQFQTMDPSQVSVGRKSPLSTLSPTKTEPKAAVSVSDVLKDPSSTAHSFMQKAHACRERGDLQGYFAYHDHAMTWAQSEARSRAA